MDILDKRSFLDEEEVLEEIARRDWRFVQLQRDLGSCKSILMIAKSMLMIIKDLDDYQVNVDNDQVYVGDNQVNVDDDEVNVDDDQVDLGDDQDADQGLRGH